MQGIPFEFRSYIRNKGGGWPKTFLGLEARSGRTHRVNARAPERGRAVDGRLRDGSGLSQRSLEGSHCCPHSPSTVPTMHMRWSSRAKLASGVRLFAEQLRVCFWTCFSFFFFFCQYVTKYMNLKVWGRTKKWQKLRYYKLQGPRGREHDKVSLESSCSHFNHLDKSSRIRRYADRKCNFSQSNQVVTETGTSSMIDINTISIKFCIGSNRI